MTHLEHARALRASQTPHYNCCQSVLVPFAAEMGLTGEQAYALGSHFAMGMKHGSTCGAITGALMVLGLTGRGPEDAAALLDRFREGRGALTCPELLKAARARGEDRKAHCSGLVFSAVEAVDELLGNG